MDPKLEVPKRSPWLITLFAVLGVVLVFTLYRTARRPESASRETTTTAAEMAPDPDAPLVGAANATCASHASCAEAELCTRGRCDPITSRTTECSRAMIRFARTTAALSSTAEMTVERAARCIKAGRPPTIVFEESRDTYASRQSNEDLTKARLKSVRDALEKRGVARESIDAIDAQR